MGPFKINLPDNQTGDVRWGRVRKIDFSLSKFLKRQPDKSDKTGYIVTVAPNATYRLFRSTGGACSADPEGAVELPHGLMRSIRQAILEKERTV